LANGAVPAAWIQKPQGLLKTPVGFLETFGDLPGAGGSIFYALKEKTWLAF
jgi:hypothetical protein